MGEGILWRDSFGIRAAIVRTPIVHVCIFLLLYFFCVFCSATRESLSPILPESFCQSRSTSTTFSADERRSKRRPPRRPGNCHRDSRSGQIIAQPRKLAHFRLCFVCPCLIDNTILEMPALARGEI